MDETRIRELDRRAGDGVDVALLWRKSDNQVRVAVRNVDSGEVFEIVVAPERALDAFRHPFAYAALNGMPIGPAQFAATPA